MKDRFSANALHYATYRPQYPLALFQFVLQQVKEKKCAWDAGTGNGQVAGILAEHFEQVVATDISARQIEHAIAKPNITYQVQPAEFPVFENEQFDLITVGQAVHWFLFGPFFEEVNRTLKPGGIIAMWGYGLIQTNGPLHNVLHDFYYSLDKYWDIERKHIDDAYANIPFPFTPINAPSFSIKVKWKPEELIGYLSTWSAIAQYKLKEHDDPIPLIKEPIMRNWGVDLIREFIFPVFMKTGKKLI